MECLCYGMVNAEAMILACIASMVIGMLITDAIYRTKKRKLKFTEEK